MREAIYFLCPESWRVKNENTVASSTSDRALEETADRLRRAQKAGRLGTWDWNITTNELIWDGVEAVHGLPEGSFGGTFDGYLADMHPEDRDRVLQAIDSARETGSELDIEYRIVLADGSVRWVSGRGTCFLDAAGKTARMAGTCQDITERKLADQQKEDLFSFASHELRNPLTSILGFARLLERRLAEPGKPLEEDGMEAIRTISAESQRMAEILETFLDLARAESAQLEIDLEEADLVEVLQDEIERLQAKTPDATVHGEFERSSVSLRTDLRRLRQVLSNLLDNAVKYGGSPPEVWVHCSVHDGTAEVRVTDNGEGISSEDRQHLFGRFYRGSARNSQRKGLGIGLYLSRQFVERLGGTLDLESPPGQAAVFVLRFPVSE
jgi:signal transduction histidine kinase